MKRLQDIEITITDPGVARMCLDSVRDFKELMLDGHHGIIVSVNRNKLISDEFETVVTLRHTGPQTCTCPCQHTWAEITRVQDTEWHIEFCLGCGIQRTRPMDPEVRQQYLAQYHQTVAQVRREIDDEET